ncbi:MAG TPA: dihydrofolate reductase [Desulfobulbaceae bacterium]|nr:dihydrofolate reductase [Desulfobulbaceae bacterium]
MAAMAANKVIGKDNKIPWDIPGEQHRFKELTMGHALIMGRKTRQAIGRPLPGRRNIVISRNSDFRAGGSEVVHSLEEGIGLCANEMKIFIIGGEQIYRLALPFADTIILSVLPYAVTGDACFPEFSPSKFKQTSIRKIPGREPYIIKTFTRCN